MPRTFESWRPLGLRVVSLSQRSLSLGQSVSQSMLTVDVVDVTGKPIPEADVEVRGAGPVQTGKTDQHGRVDFAVQQGPLDVRAIVHDLVVTKEVTSEELKKGATAFMQFPICVTGPIVRPIDLLIFGTAGAMIAAGSHFKIRALEMTGEVALGAAMFGLIYRLSCV